MFPRQLSTMAAALTVLLFFLHIFTFSALESASEQVVPQRHPHITGCASTNMETFRCRWNVGTSQRLSEPGELRLFYINKKSPHAPPEEWRECPHYSTDRPNECFFNETYTSIWTFYSVQLRSRDEATLYDEYVFNVEYIVQPDPPVSLNWTLLNMSLTGTYFDTMLSWKPPQSADVESGWMTLQYEVQYRDVSSDLWEVTDVVRSSYRTLYGLQTNVNHEVRVRCKTFGGKEFGDFSESVFIHIPSKERDSLLVTVNGVQQTLQEQCNLRVENEKLKKDMADLKQQSETTAKDREAEVQQLVSEMRAEGERHKGELETARQQCWREVEDAHRQAVSQLAAKDAEVKKLLEKKDAEVEEMKKRLKEQEKERQSELLKLQMEFGAKLARVQSTAQWSQQQQQQQHGSNLLPQSVFKRKLQFFQEEKNKEIAALRQRIKELEENQRAWSVSDSRLKRRKI